MSGFERILARVSGDALRDYCASAIEDELRSLKDKMRACLASVERALEVQDAILKLDVPLADSADAFAAIQRSYQQFDAELGGFLADQKKVLAAQPAAEEHAGVKRSRPRAGSATSEREVTRLLRQIQGRIATKKRGEWVPSSIADGQSIAAQLRRCAPPPEQRKHLVLVLDHFLSAVLLSTEATDAVLAQLTAMIGGLEGADAEIDEYLRSARQMVASKRSIVTPHFAVQEQPQPQSQASLLGVRVVDPQHFNSRNASVVAAAPLSPRLKRAKVEEHNAVDLIVKAEGGAAAPEGVCEVHVYDLPWGALQADVEAYFRGAGAIASLRMPTMDDGSTVGVAIIRFAAPAGLHAALRMDGYHFQGRSIRVTVPGATTSGT